jgi:hypothetical protein
MDGLAARTVQTTLSQRNKVRNPSAWPWPAAFLQRSSFVPAGLYTCRWHVDVAPAYFYGVLLLVKMQLPSLSVVRVVSYVCVSFSWEREWQSRAWDLDKTNSNWWTELRPFCSLFLSIVFCSVRDIFCFHVWPGSRRRALHILTVSAEL